MKSKEKVYKTMISRPVELGLRSIGVWPDSMFPRLYQYLWAIGMIMALIFQFSYIIVRIEVDDLLDLLDCFSTSLSYVVVFSKMIFFWLNRSKLLLSGLDRVSFKKPPLAFWIKTWGQTLSPSISGILFDRVIMSRIFYWILRAIEEDWKENVGTDWSRRIIYEKTKLSEICSNWIMGIDVSAAFFYGVAIIMAEAINYPTTVDSVNFTKTFVLKMEFPFDSQTSPIYELVVVAQLTHEVAMVAVGATVNAVVVTLVLHISGQIDIIRERLLSMNNSSESTLAIIKSLVNKHHKIIIFSENIERLFSYIALVQFLMLTLLICCIGLRLVISLDTQQDYLAVTLLKLFGYYFCKNMEAFIICYAGEYLSEKSKSIGDAAYNCLWYNMSKNECSLLLPLILRSQKQLRITIGKFMDLSLRRFAAILKASASYMSVLYALY
ncbi:odorant receptor 13a-like [Prorops nasuta]|uniref:odorant receptor 13a-like n=1 Tax=Prorops nasuta TaxID=863751 RepID=UPI0034CEAA6C